VAQKVQATKKVLLSDVPYQVSDDCLRTLLSGYGTVVGIARQHHAGTSIQNGKVEVDIQVETNIPKALKIASNFTINVEYSGQRDECKNCGSLAHFTSKCPRPRPCYICKKGDHKAINCPNAKECFRCRQKGHLIKNCRQTVTEGAIGGAGAKPTTEGKDNGNNGDKDKANRRKANQDTAQSIADTLATVLASVENTTPQSQSQSQRQAQRETETGECSSSDSDITDDISETGTGAEKRSLDDSVGFQASTPVNRKKKKKKNRH